MSRDEMYPAITAQRLRLIATLEDLTAEEWNAPSLCAGWQVRDVVGHLLSILEIPLGRFLREVARARSFDVYTDRVARELGSDEPESLVRRYRAQADKRFAPPIVGPIAPLTDVLVHSRDIERPLGRPSQLDPAALETVLDYICGGRAWGFIPPKRTKGLRFEATDLSWARGDGPVVGGTGEAIMMAVVDRRGAIEDLVGDGVALLAARLD